MDKLLNLLLDYPLLRWVLGVLVIIAVGWCGITLMETLAWLSVRL